FLFQLSWNFFGDVLRSQVLVVPDNRFHGEQINYALKLIFLSDWNLNCDRLGIEALANGINCMLEIGAHLVNLVDEANSRNTVLVGLPPDFFRLRLYAMDRVKHSDGAIEHAQGPLYFGGEIHVAGSINNVDANVTPGAGRCSGRDGDRSEERRVGKECRYRWSGYD